MPKRRVLITGASKGIGRNPSGSPAQRHRIFRVQVDGGGSISAA